MATDRHPGSQAGSGQPACLSFRMWWKTILSGWLLCFSLVNINAIHVTNFQCDFPFSLLDTCFLLLLLFLLLFLLNSSFRLTKMLALCVYMYCIVRFCACVLENSYVINATFAMLDVLYNQIGTYGRVYMCIRVDCISNIFHSFSGVRRNVTMNVNVG